MINKICVIGGGTAGACITAYLLKTIENISLVLIDPEEIKPIRVGESGFPSLPYFNDIVDISDNEMLIEASATPKLGIEFKDFYKIGDTYFHAFNDANLSKETLIDGKLFNYDQAERDYENLNHLYPNKFTYHGYTNLLNISCLMKNHKVYYEGLVNKSYHFDPDKYKKLVLRKIDKYENFTRLDDKVQSFNRDEQGTILNVTTANDKTIAADLFIDCTGFHGVMESDEDEHKYYDDKLFNDTAFFFKEDYVSQRDIFFHTLSEGTENGWKWNIPIRDNVSIGYVCSSKYCDPTKYFEEVLKKHKPITEPKTIKFRPQVLKNVWVKNLVRLGLSSGFLEPLEANGLATVFADIAVLANLLKKQKYNALDVKQYNERHVYLFDDTANFILYHYIFTQRRDSEYWKNISLIDSLYELPKVPATLTRNECVLFVESSWKQILWGNNSYNSFNSYTYDLYEKDKQLLNDLKNSYGEAINHKVGMRDMILQSSTTFPAYLKDQQKFYDDMKSKGYS
tara:strand:- start:567 stop:2099 length:1533 start_codon:yes stop_codon:yes gene_type:complete